MKNKGNMFFFSGEANTWQTHTHSGKTSVSCTVRLTHWSKYHSSKQLHSQKLVYKQNSGYVLFSEVSSSSKQI